MTNPKLHSYATFRHSAGGATNSVLKADSGTLHRVIIAGDLSAGASTRTTLYDNASTASGTVITELLELHVLGTALVFDLDFTNGLAINVDSGAPGSFVTIVYS